MIGLGVGEQHVAGYRAHAACAVRSICDVDPERLAAVAARHPGIAATTDPDAVLTDPAIDVVSIASYDDAHAAQVLTALEHGKHVFVEKPLCLRAEELGAIRAALDERPGLALGSNLVLRASPRFRRLHAMIRSGDLGDLYHLEAAYNYGRLRKITEGWRGQLPYYSVMLGGGVHMADLLLWLSGRKAVEVCAFGNAIASRGSGFRFNDLVTGVVRFEDGATATLTANFGCVLPHGHALSVYGTRATFVNDHPHGRLHTSRDPAATPEPITEAHPGAAKGDLIPAFVASILEGGPPPIPPGEILHAVAVCLALERSALDGGSVQVQDP